MSGPRRNRPGKVFAARVVSWPDAVLSPQISGGVGKRWFIVAGVVAIRFRRNPSGAAAAAAAAVLPAKVRSGIEKFDFRARKRSARKKKNPRRNCFRGRSATRRYGLFRAPPLTSRYFCVARKYCFVPFFLWQSYKKKKKIACIRFGAVVRTSGDMRFGTKKNCKKKKTKQTVWRTDIPVACFFLLSPFSGPVRGELNCAKHAFRSLSEPPVHAHNNRQAEPLKRP